MDGITVLNENTSKTRSRILVLTGSLDLLMFLYALTVTMIGPLIPTYMQQYQISLSAGGLTSLFRGVGGLMAAVICILISDRVKKTGLIKISFIIYMLAVVAMATSPAYLILLMLFFFVGISTKVLDISLNAYISELHVKHRAFHVNLLHILFGLGAFSGPIVSSFFLEQKLPISLIFLMLGAVGTVIFLLYLFIQGAVPEQKKSNGRVRWADLAVLAKSRGLVLLCMISFMFTGFVISFSTWMPTFMMEGLKTGVYLSGVPVSAMWIGIVLGRLLYTPWFKKLKAAKFFMVSNILCTAVLIIALICNDPTVYILAYGAAGMLIGAAIPLSVVIGNQWQPNSSGAIASMINFFCSVANLMIPWLIGVVSQGFGLYAGISSLIILPLITIALAFFLPREREEAKRGIGPGSMGSEPSV